MGLCASNGGGSANGAEDQANKDIEKDQAQSRRKNEERVKLLLLGAGESGKSTIFKQMKFLYGNPYDNDELRNLVPVVHNNVLQNFILVLEYGTKTKQALGSEAEEARTAFMTKFNEDSLLTAEVADLIRKCWKDEVFQQMWADRSKYQVLESLAYYCQEENLSRYYDKGFVPTKMDILQSRVRTSGIIEDKYVIDGVNFVMFDVGGQRNERKKWINCFDNVTAVIFVAAISEYDQVLYEENSVQRMDEAIKLFTDICNNSAFRKTSMILFLNKKDIFEDKLFRIPYRLEGVRNDDFQGPHANDANVDPKDAIEAATQHSLGRFTSVNQDPEKKIYHHVTCATDTHNVQVVFNACKDTILRSNLATAGFLPQ